MSRLGIGVRVRYIGQPWAFNSVVLLLLVGRTGVIRSTSARADCDWFVEMDEGCFDLDAQSIALVPVDEEPAQLARVQEAAVA